MKKLITGAAALLLCVSLHAQDKTTKMDREHHEEVSPEAMVAKERAAKYAEALGLNTKEQTALYEEFLRLEREKAPAMADLQGVQKKIDTIDQLGVAKIEEGLTEKQRKEIGLLRENGKWSDKPAGCAGHAEAKGCCAGKASAGADKGTKTAAPNSMAPASK